MGFKDNSQAAKEAINDAGVRFLFQACLLVEGQAVALATTQTARLKNSIDHTVDEDEYLIASSVMPTIGPAGVLFGAATATGIRFAACSPALPNR